MSDGNDDKSAGAGFGFGPCQQPTHSVCSGAGLPIRPSHSVYKPTGRYNVFPEPYHFQS